MSNGEYMTQEAAKKALLEHYAKKPRDLIRLLAEVVKTLPNSPAARQAALLIDDTLWFTEE